VRLRLDENELRRAVERALFANPLDPDPEDLVKLYLFLPVDVVSPFGGRHVRVRSSLEALLTDAHRATGRDDEGDVIDAGRLGTWLGAMGYLALIDQVGKTVRWTDRAGVGRTDFEAILSQAGVSAADAAALYALRNAMVHSYGLANEHARRPELQHFFQLNIWGGSPLVEHPARPWSGDPNDVADQTTTVSLEAVGNLGEVLVLDLAESFGRHRNIEINPALTPASMRRKVFFVHDSDVEEPP
jgi:hypothetical protein